MSNMINNLLMLTVLCIVTLNYHQHCNCVYIYGLVLHNPIPDDLGLNNHKNDEKDSNFHQLYRYGSDKDIQNKQNNNDKQLEMIEGHDRIRCKQDSDCIYDDGPDNEELMYCDRHYGYCDFFRQIGELCRYDSQCDAGLICMFGHCEKPAPPGEAGTRCNDSSDCNPGLCCARQHGERICKPKLKHGQQCFVPLGGLNYSLNELCPCNQGLECRSVKSKNSKR